MLICFNGEFINEDAARISLQDGAVLFGETLFETLKASGQTIIFAKEHLDRLEHAANLLGFPCQRERIEQALDQLAAKLATPCSRLRLTLGRGEFAGLDWPAPEQGWFLITTSPYEQLMEIDEQPEGLTCVIAPNRRVNPVSHLPQFKRGNYADCLYARNYARQSRADEALFVDEQGAVLEGATTNIFARFGHILITPPCGHTVLNGINRQQIVNNFAKLLDLQIEERDLPLEDLKTADEVFLTNSLIDVQPVKSIDGDAVSQGECWKLLLILLRRSIEG